MAAFFDEMAESYDREFTSSRIGKIQREQVWQYLNKFLPSYNKLDILELNCGTGIDAIKFASMGHRVLACDISEEMLKIAEQNRPANQKNIEFKVLDINKLTTDSPAKYDLIFSNFGGLNCLNNKEIGVLLNKLPLLIKPGGCFIAVIMPKNCIVEMLYFILKFQFRNAFRRLKRHGIEVNLKGRKSMVYYYNPSYFKRVLKPNWTEKGRRGIGFAVPPSYLESFFSKRTYLLNVLKYIDDKVAPLSFSALFSDHFLIDFKLKE